jgi:hypothetical protein
MSFLLVMTNTASLNVAKKQKYHVNAAIIGIPCLRGRSRENVSEKRAKNEARTILGYRLSLSVDGHTPLVK